MNLRTILLAATVTLTLAAVAGCDDGSSTNSGGTGGATGGTGGATGGAGGAACETCGEYVTLQDGGDICAGTSTDLYNALADCICAGACKDLCTDSICAGTDISTDCQNCVIDTAAGCGNEFGECSNDI